MSWNRPDSYGFAAAMAVLIHLLVAGLFLIEWPQPRPHPIEPVPQHMLAKVIQEENTAVKERKRKAELEKKRQQQAAKRRAENERKRKLEAQRQQEKARQKKLKKQKLAQQKQARQKAAAEKQRKEEAKRLAEQQAEAEQQKKQQEQQLSEQLAQEQAAEAMRQRQKQQQARAEQVAVLTSEYTVLIHDQVQSRWRYPFTADATMEVELRLTLVPTGEVIQIQVIKSSGNAALDNSVQKAIRAASPLPVPDDIAVFEQNFRNFTMKFRPENAS